MAQRLGSDYNRAMTLRDDQKLAVPTEVLSRVLDGEAVLLDLGKGRYYGLNDVGSAAWDHIQKGCTVGELRGVLLGEYDVDEATLKTDLEGLVAELVERGLVETS